MSASGDTFLPIAENSKLNARFGPTLKINEACVEIMRADVEPFVLQ